MSSSSLQAPREQVYEFPLALQHSFEVPGWSWFLLVVPWADDDQHVLEHHQHLVVGLLASLGVVVLAAVQADLHVHQVDDAAADREREVQPLQHAGADLRLLHVHLALGQLHVNILAGYQEKVIKVQTDQPAREPVRLAVDLLVQAAAAVSKLHHRADDPPRFDRGPDPSAERGAPAGSAPVVVARAAAAGALDALEDQHDATGQGNDEL
mmetsp:Transcript_3478/g.10262  ORF Transcript_3478/g.10262 Transcript_3478/m.10262 type:complete len:210 (+) Transcript_3478:1632-2261(+)